MIFFIFLGFAILGVISFIYLCVGIAALGWAFYTKEINLKDVERDPLTVPLIIISWPAIVLEEIGYL